MWVVWQVRRSDTAASQAKPGGLLMKSANMTRAAMPHTMPTAPARWGQAR